MICIRGGTLARLEVECLFRKADAEAVQKVLPGKRVTVQGKCAGRFYRERERRYHVRLDNCRLVPVGGPEPSLPRVEVRALVRDYEEDLRPFLLPPPGAEVRVERPLSVSDLDKELQADREAFLRKYRFRFVTVSGQVLGKEPGSVTLESTDTDQTLKVRCLFDRAAFLEVEDGPDLRVRGLCTGLEDTGALRLDDCEVVGPRARKDTRRLTAEYLPHDPGRTLTYDVAVFPLVGKKAPQVVRQVWHQQEKGLTETVTTHVGTLPPRKSLFDPAEKGAWASERRTKKVRVPGPVFHRRTSETFVEIGHRVVVAGGKAETVWEPVLKVGARVGDSWRWLHDHVEHTYTLAELGEYRGRPCAIIKEVMITNLDDQHPREVRHLYLLGVGEVERRETLRVSAKEKKTTAERRLVSFTGSRKLEGTTSPPP
jgi:hypothetical protein